MEFTPRGQWGGTLGSRGCSGQKVIQVVQRHTLTDAQWECLAPLLPAERPKKRGHPYHSHRKILNGILWILATGAP